MEEYLNTLGRRACLMEESVSKVEGGNLIESMFKGGNQSV